MSWTWRASNSARLYNESRSATISRWSRGLPLDCGIGRAGAFSSVVDLLEVFPGFAFGFLVVLAEQVGGAAIPLFGCGMAVAQRGAVLLAAIELEADDSGSPIGAARAARVLLGIPERAIVRGIHLHGAVVAPTAGGRGLIARANLHGHFTTEGAANIVTQTARDADSGVDRRARDAVADADVPEFVGGGRAHPATGGVGVEIHVVVHLGRVGAGIANFDYLDTGYGASGWANTLREDQGFAVGAEVPIRQTIHGPQGKGIQLPGSTGLRHAYSAAVAAGSNHAVIERHGHEAVESSAVPVSQSRIGRSDKIRLETPQLHRVRRIVQGKPVSGNDVLRRIRRRCDGALKIAREHGKVSGI